MWRDITPDNLNPSVVFPCLILYMKTSRIYYSHGSYCLFSPSFYGQHIQVAINAPGLIFTPSCTELLEIVVYKTDGKRQLLTHGREDVVIALENRYPSKNVTASFHKYPASPWTATQWKK